MINEVQQTDSPDLRHRAHLGPRLPSGMVIAAGRDDGWPVFLHVPTADLQEKLGALVDSPARDQIRLAVIDSYGAILLLRGLDETANITARKLVKDAIITVESSLADLPKRISKGPQLIEFDPSLPAEQIIAWSLGVNGKDLAQPVVAVVYGRGRLAGPALSGAALHIDKLRDQLALVGADCECVLDHSWMTAGSIPLSIRATDDVRIMASLGFDPAAASVKSEVHQILLTQSQIARDPAASRGGGYRKTPLEIVPIALGLPVAMTPGTLTSGDSSPRPLILGSAAALVVIGFAVWKMCRSSRRN